ncbi:FAD-dependent monooxygenase [Mycolicibacterium aubagnense]|uniref:FAD-dependent oxidoreductase n=1 Tax=Mycolicibacterium aubagnense TaxID=319707 RepID=A0ABN5YR70_9MYCO|nr:FAD-dependent monooxygenase [Mycolicibacterium aubagnense]TLH62257.1 FAD-dependent oxidoreductase [Mycolicibacterium aubagnense]WGI30444.1 FAD-dependent monooxygenase [Mycolicibacterium aubagnense]BBX82654.1 FAD-dependent oxidoreductase [Mycolicibacterium aubagnense]
MIHDVVIVGAGPVGLFLASELRLTGASVLVLERAENPKSPLKSPPFGLRGLSVTTVEALYRRGLLTDVQAGRQPHHGGGHFAGITWDAEKIDAASRPYRLTSPADVAVATTMEHIETVLINRASELGVDIHWGTAVHDVLQSDNEVCVAGGNQAFRARWLVGCDGGRSVVRKRARFEFAGTEPRFTGYSVQVELSEGESLPLGRHCTPTGMYVQSQPGTFAIADFDWGASHRNTPITIEHIQAVLRRVTGIALTVTAIHTATTWTDRAFQATTYRQGRVLLAGDAAHIHSPLGGQGLNLGLGDAMNLGWKLGAVIKGAASRDLLDGFCRERHPVGAEVLNWSRAQVVLLEPTASARAMAGIVRDLMATRDGATYFAERAQGLYMRYDLGGRHQLIGCSAPDFELADGTRLGALLRDGVGVLFDFQRNAGLQAIGHRFRDGLRYVGGPAKDQLGLGAVLVRPDGMVAWACDDEPDCGAVVDVLSQWVSLGRERAILEPRWSAAP